MQSHVYTVLFRIPLDFSAEEGSSVIVNCNSPTVSNSTVPLRRKPGNGRQMKPSPTGRRPGRRPGPQRPPLQKGSSVRRPVSGINRNNRRGPMGSGSKGRGKGRTGVRRPGGRRPVGRQPGRRRPGQRFPSSNSTSITPRRFGNRDRINRLGSQKGKPANQKNTNRNTGDKRISGVHRKPGSTKDDSRQNGNKGNILKGNSRPKQIPRKPNKSNLSKGQKGVKDNGKTSSRIPSSKDGDVIDNMEKRGNTNKPHLKGQSGHNDKQTEESTPNIKGERQRPHNNNTIGNEKQHRPPREREKGSNKRPGSRQMLPTSDELSPSINLGKQAANSKNYKGQSTISDKGSDDTTKQDRNVQRTGGVFPPEGALGGDRGNDKNPTPSLGTTNLNTGNYENNQEREKYVPESNEGTPGLNRGNMNSKTDNKPDETGSDQGEGGYINGNTGGMSETSDSNKGISEPNIKGDPTNVNVDGHSSGNNDQSTRNEQITNGDNPPSNEGDSKNKQPPKIDEPKRNNEGDAIDSSVINGIVPKIDDGDLVESGVPKDNNKGDLSRSTDQEDTWTDTVNLGGIDYENIGTNVDNGGPLPGDNDEDKNVRGGEFDNADYDLGLQPRHGNVDPPSNTDESYNPNDDDIYYPDTDYTENDETRDNLESTNDYQNTRDNDGNIVNPRGERWPVSGKSNGDNIPQNIPLPDLPNVALQDTTTTRQLSATVSGKSTNIDSLFTTLTSLT